ncbi:MAG: MarR family winged helix-turn-helix transcriptional regulator [Clostridiales bacterium]|nr:MarR family winged helix-turn-helix transcriptional regulator [Clostridiales bacterium]
MAKKYEALKIENQLCFPLYACAKEVVKKYRPYLEQVDLTYTQYITMMVLWEYKEMNVKELGGRIYLDSGTLTPLLKKLEKKGLVSRKRSEEDERNLIVSITEQGMQMREKACGIPTAMRKCIPLTEDEVFTLYHLLYKILEKES